MYVCMYVKLLNGCQISFGLLPAKSQIFVRMYTASFLQKLTVSENSLRTLFANDARRQLAYIIFFIQFGDNILRNAVFARFFDKS